MRQRHGTIPTLLSGLMVMVIPPCCWALSTPVAHVLAQSGAVIHCGSQAMLLGNELRLVPQGLLVIDATVAAYVQQVTSGVRGLQAVTSMKIGVIKYGRMAVPPAWLVCNLDQIDDPVTMDALLQTSTRDSDGGCSVKPIDPTKPDEDRLIGYLTDSNDHPLGKVTVRVQGEAGLITLTRLSSVTPPQDAEAIRITIGPKGPALDPASQCSGGDVPRAVPVRAGTPEESPPSILPTPSR